MDIKFDTTLERDMDLLIMEEFISSTEFSDIFLRAIGFQDTYAISKIIHSKLDIELGESDIVIVLDTKAGRHALLIEDKIDAQAMPRQQQRYILRAEKDMANGEYDSYSVFIVAPKKYLSQNSEAKLYPHHVSYEQLHDYFSVKKDARSQYKLALIKRAIADQKNGYQLEANKDVVRFCTAMNLYQKAVYPGLPTGSIAWWPHRNTISKDVTLVFKANVGFCDLTFRGYTKEQLYIKVKKHLTANMVIVQTGKSASVRIIVSPIPFEKQFDEMLAQVDESLSALAQLFELSKKLIE